MKLPLGVTISAAIHLAAVAFGSTLNLERPADPVEPTTIEVISVPPPAVEAPPVRLPDEPTPAVTAVPAPVAPKKKHASRVAATSTSGAGNAKIETTGTGTGTPTGTEPTGPRSKFFDMRKGSRADLTLPNIRDDLDHAPAGTTPQVAVAPSGQLEDAAGGRKKSNQDVFIAKIERDGTVKIRDTKNLTAELSWNPAKLLSGRFDITDYLMRKTKNDPYSSRKLKFLDETRDERVEIGKKWRQQQLQQTAMIMRKNLERAWASSVDVEARKRALFDLWDEIVEPKSADDQADEVLAEASRAARKAVIGFIRAHLPAGSEHAYSDGELLALNSKKQSAAQFSPYE